MSETLPVEDAPVGAVQLKQIPPGANSFEANGKKYLIHNSLSVARFRKLHELQVIAGFGADYQTLYQTLKDVYNLLEEPKLASASVKINGVLEGIARELNKQYHPLLLICTLFMCPEGSDITRWNEAEAGECIEDWNTEGYDIQGFFTEGLRFLRQFALNLQPGTPATSNEAE